MEQVDDKLGTISESRRRDMAQMTLGELLLAGHELRRRSQVVFNEMIVLEEALRLHLTDGTNARTSSALPEQRTPAHRHRIARRTGRPSNDVPM